MSGGVLLAIDWGTSSLRGALLDESGHAFEQRHFPRGILTVEPGGFRAVFDECFGDWHARTPLTLISGMAGSRQGWCEAPYAPCPATPHELASQITWIEPGRIGIVPGVCCHRDGVPDVMRGEEVQVFGAMELLGVHDMCAVLPGTHSKWVQVHHGRIASFATFMTGEFYALLRKHSILARTMPEQDGPLDEDAFREGVRHAQRAGSLTHAAFSARTLALFDKMPAHALPSYLSGLVIGEELRAGHAERGDVVVIGAPELARRYTLALDAPVRCIGDDATWRGLASLARSLA